MPKMKTSKSAAKRIVKITRNDKMIAGHMSAQHRRKGKSKRVKRQSHDTIVVIKGDTKKLKRMLPYGVSA